MNARDLKKILNDLHEQKLTPQQAIKKLTVLPYENLGFARVDHHRSLRLGMPEVIYCQGKTVVQIKKIIQSINRAGHSVLATKLSKDSFRKLKPSLPKIAEYNEMAQTLVIEKNKHRKKNGLITIISAGTSDIPIAEEASVTAQLLGSKTETLFDVGVAGIHRLLDNLEQIRKARVVIVGRNGRSPRQCGRGPDRQTHHSCAYQHWLWNVFWRCFRPSNHVKQLRTRNSGGQHRQRIWSWKHGPPHQHSWRFDRD